MVSKEKLLRILGRYKGRKKDEASSLWYRKFEANGSLSPPKVLDSHRFKKKKKATDTRKPPSAVSGDWKNILVTYYNTITLLIHSSQLESNESLI